METLCDDIVEAIKKDQFTGFTDHLNAVDETGSIRFTYEEESNGTIPFLDLLLKRQLDGVGKVGNPRIQTSICISTHTTTLTTRQVW